MWDRDVRLALHAVLEEQHGHERSETKLIDELSLAGEVRVDVAVLNGSFSGYEIKSAHDTLRRLPKQVEVYSKMLDHMTLVVADKHVSHALPLLPEWWGVVTATSTDEGLVLAEERSARPNPKVDPSFLATLLWREELLAALEERGIGKGVRSKPRHVLMARLVERTSADEMRVLVREQLKVRANWRGCAA
ncbi:sce7726 family protein [Arthrobacter sp. ISL-48]|uniref:sce7726 family protein n=1 Tax=Arthrobacter sp. ISL-48 TaxID=2819110 RepID=UPI001BEBBDE6|nr:sce7726 family protein [Arthrobacter sp. ISL-48]MBT2533921.1 sce7726 family protein [Arthrobacter sp. ISL-48]